MSEVNSTPTSSEEWRPIAGFPGYEVSSCGRVRSFWERGIEKGQKGFRSVLSEVPHEMNQRPDKYGYLTVGPRTGGRQSWKKVHNLMLRAFIGPPPTESHQGCHKDDDKRNNFLPNLYWGTPRENIHDRGKNGRTACGERCRHAKLTTEQAREIFARADGTNDALLAAEFKVHKAQVGYIRRRDTWRHATG